MYNEEQIPDSEFGRTFRSHFVRFIELNDIMALSMDEWVGCGSYLIGPPNWLDYNPKMQEKQELLFDIAKNLTEESRVLEVGVHGGHSLLIMLIAHPLVKITCVDICCWSHTKKCVEYLNTHFNNRVNLICGDSMSVLPTLCAQPSFDLIHIDGDHNEQRVRNDIHHAYALSHPNTTFIFDDYQDSVFRVLNEKDQHDKFLIASVPNCSWYNCLAYRRDRSNGSP